MPSYGFDSKPIDPDKLRDKISDMMNTAHNELKRHKDTNDTQSVINKQGVIEGLNIVYDELSDQKLGQFLVEDDNYE